MQKKTHAKLIDTSSEPSEPFDPAAADESEVPVAEIAASSTSRREHWLLIVLQNAGRNIDQASSDLPPNLSTFDAWERARELFGLDESELASIISREFDLPLADLGQVESATEKLVPANLAQRAEIVPLRCTNRDLFVATANPTDVQVEQDLTLASGRVLSMEIATPSQIKAALVGSHAPDRALESLLGTVSANTSNMVRVLEEESPDEVVPVDLSTGPVVKLVNLILADAVQQRATDIHVQPKAGGGMVRFRVDGLLRAYLSLPRAALNRVVSRIKILAKMDISDRLRPQDGRARIIVGDKTLDTRISTVPTRGSEKAVIRLLDPESSADLTSLGIPEGDLEAIQRLLANRNGIIPVTGPTGSGKTTTLYGALRLVSTPEVNVMTVEDPVEYELSGLTQIQVEPKRGVTFESALRAILRQDPDIVLLGEIRDVETAEIAVQASLTGHLVLTTLHTNDAIGAVRRLSDLGLDLTSICETLRGAVAQRLVRKVCSECCVEVGTDPTDVETALSARFGIQPAVRAVGCEVCQNTGFDGRIPILEVFTMSEGLEHAIREGQSAGDLRAVAEKDGMRTLMQSARGRVEAGETTLEEVERVLGDQVRSRVVPSGKSQRTAEVTSVQESKARGHRTGVRRVLLVDDDPVSRRVAYRAVTRTGYDCVECGDGQEAVDLLERDPDFSIVIVDLTMPRLNGRDTLGWIRRNKPTAALPTMVLTGADDPEVEMELLAAGADDFVRKPIKGDRFIARVNSVLRRAEY